MSIEVVVCLNGQLDGGLLRLRQLDYIRDHRTGLQARVDQASRLPVITQGIQPGLMSGEQQLEPGAPRHFFLAS